MNAAKQARQMNPRRKPPDLPEAAQTGQDDAPEDDDGFDLFDDLELDFDLGDFDLTGDRESERSGGSRILTPRIDLDSIRQHATFRRAEEFARAVNLTSGARTFAWVSGGFIFGDLLEALVVERHVWPKEIYISTLSLSQENIDSLRTILECTEVQRLCMLVSGYFYSHEKYNLVPYMYEQLDLGDKTQIAFGNYHGKIITLSTHYGHTITLHGSANLRSSNSIEQVMIEVDARELHEFNAGVISSLCKRFGTINYAAAKVPGKERIWQAVREAAGANAKAAPRRPRGGQTRGGASAPPAEG